MGWNYNFLIPTINLINDEFTFLIFSIVLRWSYHGRDVALDLPKFDQPKVFGMQYIGLSMQGLCDRYATTLYRMINLPKKPPLKRIYCNLMESFRSNIRTERLANMLVVIPLKRIWSLTQSLLSSLYYKMFETGNDWMYTFLNLPVFHILRRPINIFVQYSSAVSNSINTGMP